MRPWAEVWTPEELPEKRHTKAERQAQENDAKQVAFLKENKARAGVVTKSVIARAVTMQVGRYCNSDL